jgi:tetratricopeptide (TPR) repeat protein
MTVNRPCQSTLRRLFHPLLSSSVAGPAVRLRRCGLLLVLALLVALAPPASAAYTQDELRTDAVFMPGANIPIGNVTIERIAAGQVVYRDARGRVHRRPFEEIASLRFANLPQLDLAEQHAAVGEYRRAIRHFLQALVAAETDLQRLWIHGRLARSHDIIGEYVQAASHVAAVMLLEEHIVWRSLEPVREPLPAPYAAVAEARHMLAQARQRVTNRDLAASVARMSERVEAVHDSIKASYGGPPIQPRTTWSGFAIDDIRQGRFVPVGASADEADEIEHDAPAPPSTAPPDPEPTTPAPPREPRIEPRDTDRPDSSPPPVDRADAESDETSPAAIERLLESGAYAEAVSICRRVERNLRGRDAAQFLYQYGRALAGENRFADAAVMFTRCAILHPASEHAPRALIETAVIYRHHFNQPRTALRLLEHAERMLGEETSAELRSRIEDMRKDLREE